jgi:hypothetical protein
MEYEDFENTLSAARLNRFLIACGGDRARALNLYRLNIKLSQNFFGILSLFEVGLRNAIDRHYRDHFSDPEWLKNQCLGKGFLNDSVFSSGRFKSKKKVDASIKELGIRYSHDRVVASLSFGFWVNLFAPIQFRLAGQNLHLIFTARPKGTQPKQIFNELGTILDFRNRVAHHEPICFNGSQNINLGNVDHIYREIIKYIQWLGIDEQKFLEEIDGVTEILNIIRKMESDLFKD